MGSLVLVNLKYHFLKKIRRICDQKKIILIFDECTSGFRETDCGLHKKYNVNPDILILGKALGNGYAINAILGTEDIMKQANQTFISSTFWSEQVGLTAAFKTIEVIINIHISIKPIFFYFFVNSSFLAFPLRFSIFTNRI